MLITCGILIAITVVAYCIVRKVKHHKQNKCERVFASMVNHGEYVHLLYIVDNGDWLLFNADDDLVAAWGNNNDKLKKIMKFLPQPLSVATWETNIDIVRQHLEGIMDGKHSVWEVGRISPQKAAVMKTFGWHVFEFTGTWFVGKTPIG